MEKNIKTDEEKLLERAKIGDRNALDQLIKSYTPFVLLKTKYYFMKGGDKDDIAQEGYLGLVNAIRDYSTEEDMSFKSFANMCITRKMISAVKWANREKRSTINNSISLSKPIYSNPKFINENTLMDLLVYKNKKHLIEDFIIDKENANILAKIFKENLTKLEKQSLIGYLEGYTYKEIAQKIDSNTKSIDNALQRVRMKLKRKIEKNNLELTLNKDQFKLLLENFG